MAAITDYDLWLAEVETTYGTDAVDAALANDDPLTFRTLNDGSTLAPVATVVNPARAKSGPVSDPAITGKVGAELSLTVPLKYGVGANKVPNADPFLRAASGVRTSTAGETSYRFGYPTAESATVWRLLRETDGNYRLRKTTGAVFGIAITGNVNEEGLITFAGMGREYARLGSPHSYFSGTTLVRDSQGVVTPGSVTNADTSKPFLCKNATITFGGTAVPISTFTIDTGITPEAVQVQTTSSETSCRVMATPAAGSPPTVTLGVETCNNSAIIDTLLASIDGEVVANLVIEYSDGTNTLKITAPVQFVPVEAERINAGTTAFDLTGSIVKGPGSHPLTDSYLLIEYT